MYEERKDYYYTEVEIKEIREKHKLVIENNPIGFGNIVEIPQFILLSEDLITNNAKCLYSILYTLSGQEYSCRPLQSRIMELMGFKSGGSVRKYIGELEDLNLLETILVKGANQKHGNRVYLLNPITESNIWVDIQSKVNKNNDLFTKPRGDVIENNADKVESIGIPPINRGKDSGNQNDDKADLERIQAFERIQVAPIDNNTDSTDSSNKIEKREIRVERERREKNRSYHNPPKLFSSNQKGLFDTTKSEIKYLEDKLDKLNKNKNRLECARLRFKIADMKDDWSEVTTRDFAYYFKDIKYLEYNGVYLDTDKYFTSDINKFIERFKIDKHEYLDIMDYILEEYENVKSEGFPRVTQLLFKQDWLLDRLMERYLGQRKLKLEKIEQDKLLRESKLSKDEEKKILNEYNRDRIANGKEPIDDISKMVF